MSSIIFEKLNYFISVWFPGTGNINNGSGAADSAKSAIVLRKDFVHGFVSDSAVGAFELDKIPRRNVSQGRFGRSVFTLKFVCCIRTSGLVDKFDNFSCSGSVDPEEFIHFSIRSRGQDNTDKYIYHICKSSSRTKGKN